MDKTVIIQRIQNSDRHAFNELFNHFYKPLCRFAYTILHCPSGAEEVVQEVFLKLWENRSKMNIRISIDSYLFIAVRNNAANYSKFHQIRQKHESEIIDEAGNTTNIDEKAFKKYLERAIAMLPEQCRMIFHLKNFEGLSTTEIAEYMEISEKTVENQTSIAMKKLREYLKPYRNDLYIERHEKE